MKATGDQQLVKRINRSVLLRCMRAQPGLSRARLAQESGLTKSTVSALVRELLDEHWLVEAAAPVAGAGMGRPSTPLQLDASTRVLLGLEIGVRHMRLVALSLTGAVLLRMQQNVNDTAALVACAQAVQMVRSAWKAADHDGLILCGIGVCLPGAIDTQSGLVRFAPNLGWRDQDFLSPFTRGLARAGIGGVAVHLHNDADAAALGEYEFGSGGSADPLIFVSCDVGVGGGIVLHDRLFTGSRGLAGEVGHTVLDPQGALCSCGRRGCAETMIGANALASPLGLQRGAHALGLLIQNLGALFNPGTVVVGGSSGSAYPGLLDQARTVVNAYAKAAGVPAPILRHALYGLDAAAVGAAAVAWHEYLRPTHLQARLAAVTGKSAAADARQATAVQATRSSAAPAETEGSV